MGIFHLKFVRFETPESPESTFGLNQLKEKEKYIDRVVAQ
jgi:hypothetical protein